CRNESMWQLEREATSISSGSTAASTAHLPTTCGEADAATSVPPSKLTVWARLKRPLRNSSPLSFAAHLISASGSPCFLASEPAHDISRLASAWETRTRRLKWIKKGGRRVL